MIVTIKAILDKINDLPADFREHVHPKGAHTRATGGTAEVESFSNPLQAEPWIVHIKAARTEDLLDVTCTCPATTLCLHTVAYYAYEKDLKPSIEDTTPLLSGGVAIGKRTTEDEGQQSTVKGTRELYREIAAACNKAAAAFDKLGDME